MMPDINETMAEIEAARKQLAERERLRDGAPPPSQ